MKSGRYYNRLTDKDKKKIVKLYRQGLKQARIAERFDVSPSTIRGIISKLYEDEEKG